MPAWANAFVQLPIGFRQRGKFFALVHFLWLKDCQKIFRRLGTPVRGLQQRRIDPFFRPRR
jgi:hypothetical protein